ncbi:MAG: hypothetical protein HETSPECPRED_010543 [Heterodermia speciosa]|uniref:TauD/TfdA-like domain-containing protein n=1 Tax=Heterodermia speciosa TaxID=116794 RepID=A0A8H3GC03_9LECA|nr:MAG: hypothetical protein HETSPECPRED_010543 [Heterodermia speciosa]
MAASATSTTLLSPTVPEIGIVKTFGNYKEQASGAQAYNKTLEEEGDANHPKANYTHYLPTWDPEEKYPPLTPFEHAEHGLDADKKFPELLGPSVEREDLTPTIGTILSGIQISSLSKEGKDQLALFAAQRKVLVFKEQDFADLPIEEALGFGGYFGRHHIHPTSGAPKGHPEIHLVHRGADDRSGDTLLESRTSTVAWHSDVTYEKQPPGTTFLYILDKPSTGGDTLFANMAEAYRRLSPAFRERLHGLKAVHSGIEQADSAQARKSVVRREPVTSVHPLVRTHPATGEKALFVNPQFTRHIVGFKKDESDNLLKFLYDHIAYGADFHARVKWAEKTVVVWDNRVTSHSATLDWSTGQRRHLARITPQAEAPYETAFEG